MIGFFPAASKLTGVLTDDVATTLLLHQYGAWSFWDYTLVAPSAAVDMNPTFPGVEEEMVKKDALFFNCEKFVGGVQGPCIAVLKKDVFKNTPVYCEDVEVGIYSCTLYLTGTGSVLFMEIFSLTDLVVLSLTLH